MRGYNKFETERQALIADFAAEYMADDPTLTEDQAQEMADALAPSAMDLQAEHYANYVDYKYQQWKDRKNGLG